MKNENKTIRVLHIIGKMDLGGQETFIMNIYRNIDRNRIQFDFIVHSSDKGYYDSEIKELGGRIFVITPMSKNIFKHMKELNHIIIENNYDIIHRHTCTSVAAIDMMVAKICMVNKRIVHSHSNNISSNYLKHFFLKPILNIFANIRLACSEEAAKWLFGRNYKKAIIVNNGIDVNKYKFSQTKREKIRKELNISKNTIVLGHVGSFSKVKNHEFIIDVFNEYNKLNTNSILVLVGEGKLFDKIKEKVKKLKIEDKVKFLGLRNDTDYLYSSFDVFIFPSLYEGLSLALIEAQTSGLNIIASDKIDKLTDVTNTIKYKSIDESPKEWAKTMTLFKSKRYNNIKKISTAGYNIVDTVEKLSKIYIN